MHFLANKYTQAVLQQTSRHAADKKVLSKDSSVNLASPNICQVVRFKGENNFLLTVSQVSLPEVGAL